MKILEYDSLAGFAEYARRVPKQWQNAKHKTRYAYSEVIDLSLTGMDSLVPQAQALLDKIESATDEIPTRQWTASPYGAYPIIPEYLSGMPACMRAMQHEDTESSPVGIWLDLTSSGGISLDTLTKRGVALLALVMRLQTLRPIELHVCVGSASNGVGVKIKINTQPLDLATACFVIAHGEYARLPMYAAIRNESKDWVRKLIQNTQEFREYFEVPQSDLIILSAHLDQASALTSNPVEWVNNQLRKYTGGQE